jgi:hypothetical protein
LHHARKERENGSQDCAASDYRTSSVAVPNVRPDDHAESPDEPGDGDDQTYISVAELHIRLNCGHDDCDNNALNCNESPDQTQQDSYLLKILHKPLLSFGLHLLISGYLPLFTTINPLSRTEV